MKKFISIAIVTAALGVGGAASAQGLSNIIVDAITSLGYSQGYGYNGAQMYRDQWGRQFYYDQYGRQVYVQSQPSGVVGYDAWGRPLYNSGAYAYGYGYNYDRDRDGVADRYDRWPNDSRYR